MNDKELLALAAKAAGIEVAWCEDGLYSPSAFFRNSGNALGTIIFTVFPCEVRK